MSLEYERTNCREIPVDDVVQVQNGHEFPTTTDVIRLSDIYVSIKAF